MTVLTQIEIVLILIGWTGAAVFCLAYPAGTDPRRWTREGRHWWLVSFALVLLGVIAFARRVWPVIETHDGYHLAELFIIGLLAFLTWQRVGLYVLARREYRHSRNHGSLPIEE